MPELHFPDTLSQDKLVLDECHTLADLLNKLAQQAPDIFSKIAATHDGVSQLNPFIAVFINDKLVVDKNPPLSMNDMVIFQVAFSGG